MNRARHLLLVAVLAAALAPACDSATDPENTLWYGDWYGTASDNTLGPGDLTIQIDTQADRVLISVRGTLVLGSFMWEGYGGGSFDGAAVELGMGGPLHVFGEDIFDAQSCSLDFNGMRSDDVIEGTYVSGDCPRVLAGSFIITRQVHIR